jgi:hypothetical protein
LPGLLSQPQEVIMLRFIRAGSTTRCLVLGVVVALAACQNEDGPAGPSEPPPGLTPKADLLVTQGRMLDPLLLQALAIPGFGGLFLDPATGKPTVYLKDPGQRGTAERVLGVMLHDLGVGSTDLEVRSAAYDYVQLHGWHARASASILALPGAVFTDVDEGSNRIRIGVEHPAAEAGVRRALSRLGVPSDAVLVEHADAFHTAATLQGAASPRRGGLQINFSTKACTQGFNTRAQSGFIVVRSFITNSHCTAVQGGVQSTNYFEPMSGRLLGTEIADPAYLVGGPCPAGRKCRWSDAARVRYVTGVSSDLGGIARTKGQNSGSLTIDPANPLFNITKEAAGHPLQFSVVNKIGRTTGWTAGIVYATCAAVNVTGTNVTLFCQDLANMGHAPGDSGSPVFSWPGSGSNVSLNGIFWGGNTAGTKIVFSPFGAIEFELGPLTTF